MRAGVLVGIVLVVIGLLALVYQGITYTKKEKILDIGPIEATRSEKKTIPLSPIVGGAAVVGGIVLIIASGRAR